MLTARIVSRELTLLMRTLRMTFMTMTLSVTIAIESPKDRAILSRWWSFRKKTNVQAKPGRKKTMTKPSAARTGERLSSRPTSQFIA